MVTKERGGDKRMRRLKSLQGERQQFIHRQWQQERSRQVYSPNLRRSPKFPRAASQNRSKEQTEYLRLKIQNANEACQSGEFSKAIQLFSEIISIEPNNSILYCNRSAAYVRLNQYQAALQDALKSIQLDPEWYKGYYRQAIALQCMGRHAEALAAYASALAHDQKSQQLLQALVEASLKSNLQDSLEPLFEQLDQIEISGKAFATVAIIGQELFTASDIQPAITVLESSLQLGTDNLALKGSVYSALSSAHWKTGNIKRALHYMHQDLLIVESLADEAGICRVHGNLGNAYFSQSSYKDSEEHHQFQLEYAEQLNDQQQCAGALTSLGHVYVAMHEYDKAIDCHQRSSQIRKKLGQMLLEAKEIGNVGTVHAITGNFEKAVTCQEEHLKIVKDLNENQQVCRAMNLLGGLYQNMQKLEKSIKIYQDMFTVAQDIEDHENECNALAGLGHVFRKQGNVKAAERCHEQQLKIAIDVQSRELEAHAQADLGLTYQQKGDYDKALRYQKAFLDSCRKLNDREGEGRAYGNIGNAYQSMGQYERAVKYHKLGLSVVRDLGDKHAEASLHGNIAVGYQSLGMEEDALKHYSEHLNIAVEVKDQRSECVAESNLGNYYSIQGKFEDAVKHFENYSALASKLQDKQEMCKATHNLAFAYYQLKNYNESIEFYEENISLANDIDDRELLSQSYCNLGLAYLAMNDYEKAVRCQKLFLASAREKKNTLNVCKALGNLGKIYSQMGDSEEGLRFFYEQVRTADKSPNMNLQADCYHELAKVLENEEKYEEASMRYEKEIILRRQIDDNPSQFYQALTTYASMLEHLGKLSDAYKCYCEFFQLTKKNSDLEQCKHVCHLMGKINMKMGKYEKAVLAFRLQLECLSDGTEDSIEAGRVHVNISECYENMGEIENAILHLLQYQEIASKLEIYDDENEAFKRLSNIHISQGNYQDALMYSEKRLVCTQALNDVDICNSYQHVALIHAYLKNFDSALSYYEQLLKIARESHLKEYEYEAFKGLGNCYDLTEEFEKSLHAYKNAMDKAIAMENLHLEAESSNFIGDSYYKLKSTEEALKHFEKSLAIGEQVESLKIKVQACGRLGKIHHLLRDNEKATSYLHMAAKYADDVGDKNEQVKAFYRLGTSLYFGDAYEASQKCFQKVIELAEDNNGYQSNANKINIDSVPFIIAAYQMLQKVLILSNQPLEALFFAEKANSINLEGLLKQSGIQARVKLPLLEKFSQRIKQISLNVCFYSIVVGQLYCWLLRPREGFVEFWKRPIIQKYTDENLMSLDIDDMVFESSKDVVQELDNYVLETRKSLDVEKHERSLADRSQSFAANIEIVDRKQNRRSRIGRPVVMSNNLESPNGPAYQFRYKRPNKPEYEHRPIRNFNWFVESPVEAMYKLFAEQTDQYFEKLRSDGSIKQKSIDMTLVVPRELSLVPFTLLRSQDFEKYFSERFNLSYSPTLFWLLDACLDPSTETQNNENESEEIFVFGGSGDISTEEAVNVARVFGSSATVGNTTIKDEIVSRLTSSLVCHLATDVAWQTPSLVFPYKEMTKSIVKQRSFTSDPDIEDLDPEPRVGSPGLNDIFLTVKDISELQLQANLFTFGISPSSGYSDPICCDGLHLMVTSLLMTGCKTLLTSLWPVPDNIRRYFLHGFYKLYNKGVPAVEACNQTVRAMQSSEEYQHPTNWAGFVVYGQNSMLNRQTQSFTNALNEFLDHPNRDSIKVVLHLVEKARQRLAQDRRTSLYVAEASIMKKMPQNNLSWKPLLSALGFRFEKAHNNLPDSVFFPGIEYQDMLNNGSNTLYAFLGLSRNGLDAISRLRNAPHIGGPLIKMLQEVLYYFNQEMSNVQVSFPLQLWRLAGCHEFLSSIGFDVMGIGKIEVMLRSGKISMRRPLQCALQVVKDLFERHDEQNASDQLMNATNKAYSEMQIKKSHSNLGKKTKSENNINSIRSDETADHIIESYHRLEKSLHKSNQDLSDLSSANDFLHSDRGLFSSRETQQQKTTNENTGGVARKLRQKNQENIYGLKSDMKRYGTMEKLDVSDLVLTEREPSDSGSDEWETSMHITGGERDRMVTSPDLFYEEDIENFMEHFQTRNDSTSKRRKDVAGKSLSLDRQSTMSDGSSKRSFQSTSGGFANNYLIEKDHMLERTDSVSSSEEGDRYQIPPRHSRHEEEDLFYTKEEILVKKIKVPQEWKRLQLNNDYFENRTSIKTFSIKDTLSIDSGNSSSFDSGKYHARQSSGGFVDIGYMDHTDSSKKSPDLQSRKSLESSDDHESKKKTWLFTKRRNKKKMQKSGDIGDHKIKDEKNSSIFKEKSKNNDKSKRYSVDSLALTDSSDNKLRFGARNHRKSEGDINFNLRYAVNQQPERGSNLLSPNYGSQDDPNVQMSLC